MTDDLDRRLVDYLRGNGRASVKEIAAAIALSPAAVSRRLARLEDAGVIQGYTAIIREPSLARLEAFVEVRLSGSVDTRDLDDLVAGLDEVVAIHTVAGDPDLLVHVRVTDGDHLQKVVNTMRATGKLAGTKTLIVLDSWTRH